jgi:hypothetical protein
LKEGDELVVDHAEGAEELTITASAKKTAKLKKPKEA